MGPPGLPIITKIIRSVVITSTRGKIVLETAKMRHTSLYIANAVKQARKTSTLRNVKEKLREPLEKCCEIQIYDVMRYEILAKERIA